MLACALGSVPETSAQRIPPGAVLDRTAKAFETVRDYQAVLRQREKSTGGDTKELWARLTLVKTTQQDPDVVPTFLLEFFKQPVALYANAHGGIASASDPQPLVVYYADDSRKLYTYKPNANSLTIEPLEDHGPLPEMMQLAGFLDFDVKTLKEKAYLDDEVPEETLQGTPTWRVRIVPRQKVRETEPPRLIWIDRKTYFPKRFAVVSDFTITVDFMEQAVNRKINEKDLVPEVPKNVNVKDTTR